MKKLLEDIDAAERFLEGKMDTPERMSLADRMDRDEDFSHLIQEMDLLIDGIKYTASQSTIEEKLERLKSFARHEADDKKPRGRVIKMLQENKWYVGLAATLILCAAVIIPLVWNHYQQPTDLYAKYFEPFDSPGSGLTRSSDPSRTLKAQAYEAYDAGNYAQAAELFERALPEKDEAIVHLCLANAYMSLGEFDKAEASLIHIQQEHADLITQTKWYLALTYLKQSKLERARAILWEISKSSTYGEKARKLLKDLDE
jgi:tetratricopeptide (TPR) repeat protein